MEKAVTLTPAQWSYILGLLEGRLRKMPDDSVGKRIKSEILEQLPELKRMLDLTFG